MICATVVAVILFSVGLFRVAFAQGYVCGRESVLHPDEVIFREDDE